MENQQENYCYICEGPHTVSYHQAMVSATAGMKLFMELAWASTPEWRGEIARYAPSLTAAQRMELARASTPEWLDEIARSAPGLSMEQRMELAWESTPELRDEIAQRRKKTERRNRP